MKLRHIIIYIIVLTISSHLYGEVNYNMADGVVSGNGLVIKASLPNPIVYGDPLTLTAIGAQAPCTWDYSVDGEVNRIVSNGVSGDGNDILVDDITFSSSVLNLELRSESDVICGENVEFRVGNEGIEQIFGGTPYYLWQIFDDDAPNLDDPWVDIPEDPVVGRGSHNGSGFDKIQYDYTTMYKENGSKLRVIISADPAVAHQVGHGIYPASNVYAETNAMVVDCNCLPMEPPIIRYK